MAKAYHRPLLAFYLKEPPKRGERGEDFRSLPREDVVENAGELDALVRDIYVRQRLVRTALEEAEEAVPRPFVGSIRIKDGVERVCELVVSDLGFTLSDFRRKPTIEAAFGYLRRCIEESGVFVLLIGNLGSHHSNLSVETFRGFALADDVAPFIVINDQDAKSAWSFTALHELVHIWLGMTGISGSGLEQRVERFCNDVASQILLPAEELRSFPVHEDREGDLLQQISEFASARKVSSSMVAYRLHREGSISVDSWRSLSRRFRELWLNEKRSDKGGGKTSGGPNYYVVRRHRVGGALLDVVRRNLADGILTPTKAARVLGVRPNNVMTLLGGA